MSEEDVQAAQPQATEDDDEDSVDDVVVENLRNVIAVRDLYQKILDEAAAAHITGTLDESSITRLGRKTEMVILAQALRFRKLRLTKGSRAALGAESVEVLQEFHGRYYPLLEEVFDRIIEGLLSNQRSWTRTTSTPMLDVDSGAFRVDMRILNGSEEILNLIDFPGSLINLARSLLSRSRSAYQNARERNLRLEHEDWAQILDLLAKVETEVQMLRDEVSSHTALVDNSETV